MLSCYLKTLVKEFQFRMFISTNIICGFHQIKAKTLVKLCDSHLTSYSGPPFFICLVFSAAYGLTLLLCFPGSLLLVPIPLPLFGCCWGSRSWRSSRSRARSPRRFPFLPALFPPVVSAAPRARLFALGSQGDPSPEGRLSVVTTPVSHVTTTSVPLLTTA